MFTQEKDLFVKPNNTLSILQEKKKLRMSCLHCLPQAARSREGASLHPQGKPVAGFHLVTQDSDRDQSLT